MLNKAGAIAATWVASDVTSLLQLAWLKQYAPGMYDFTMEIVSPISAGIHTWVVEGWTLGGEIIEAIASNTS